MADRLLRDEQYASSAGGSARTRTVIKANFVALSKQGAAMTGRSRTRTVVKANFKRSGGSSARSSLKKSADYYAHRPDADGLRAQRLAFGVDHDELGRDSVQAMIDDAQGEYAYRMVLSPGRDFDEEGLIDWTRGVMRELEREHNAEWAAYAHGSQTEHPHVHVIAFLDERLDRDDFKHLREHGDLEASMVVTMWHQLERLLDEEEEDIPSGGAASRSGASSGGGGGGAKLAEILREGVEAQDEELRKRLELELD